jgi:D-alanyl-D-alanine carboxypeptidase/Putative peptidoglycan binding domain
MRVLKKGVRGDDVAQWELFLHGAGFTFTQPRDNVFDAETEKLTKAFQKKNKLVPDGIVGNATFGVAMLQGFEGVPFVDEPAAKFPRKPDFEPIVGNAARNALFGPMKFRPGPLNGDFGKETITVTNDFESTSILRTEIPELIGIKGASATGRVRFHKTCVPQLKGLWTAWGRKGLLKHILTFDGAYAPRFTRCSNKTLSNHAFGTAFDINAGENPLGAQPALPGKKGCVFELVPTAHQFGFYWGGHFSRRDGMHFEIAKRLSQAEVDQVLERLELAQSRQRRRRRRGAKSRA